MAITMANGSGATSLSIETGHPAFSKGAHKSQLPEQTMC